MVSLIKLTDLSGKTYKDTVWRKGITNQLPYKLNPRLCSGDLFHAYPTLPVALIMNASHANFIPLRIFRAETPRVILESNDGKIGCFELTVVEELQQPDWYTNAFTFMRIQLRFAYLCSQAVLPFFEEILPKDARPRKALTITKNFLNYARERSIFYTEFASLGRQATISMEAASNAASNSNVGTAQYAAQAICYTTKATTSAATHARNTVSMYVAHVAENAFLIGKKTLGVDIVTLADKAVMEETNGDK